MCSGDGRNDSPGYSAKFMTYTVMTHDSNEIVDMIVIDKREVGLKSPNMENEGLKRILERLKVRKLRVKEICTDAHASIKAMISEYM